MSGRAVRSCVVAALLLSLAGACAPPPTGGGGGGGELRECPARSQRTLASNPAAARQTPRAFSPDGQWLVTSTSDEAAAEMLLTVRRTDGTGVRLPVVQLVTVPSRASVARIVVSDDGDVSFIGRPVQAAEAGLWTWQRSTGQLLERPAPTVPFVGDEVSLEPTNLSEDGTRAVWLHTSLPPGVNPATGTIVRTVLAELASGDVVGVVDGELRQLSPDATLAIGDDGVVELATGLVESLKPARQALLADGMDFVNLLNGRLSDGGRYVAWSGFRVVFSPQGTQHVWRVYRWDRVEHTLVRNPSAGSSRGALVATSDGRVLYRRTDSVAVTSLREWNPDSGTDTSVASGTLTGSGEVHSGLGSSSAPATSDLRNVAATWLDLLTDTAHLRVSRCR